MSDIDTDSLLMEDPPLLRYMQERNPKASSKIKEEVNMDLPLNQESQ